MSIHEKIASAISAIQEHNAALTPEDKQVDEKDFQKKLRELGGTTESALREVTWEDLQTCGLPRILARKIATLFRTADKAESDKYTSQPNANQASRMNPLYLLQAYHPNDPTSAVAKRLAELSRGEKFVVLLANGDVDAQASYNILKEIQKGYKGKESVELIKGQLLRCYAIGEVVGELVDEDPLFAGEALRPDGTSDRLERSWEGVGKYIRQLIYLAIVKTGELSVNGDIDKAHEILDKAKEVDADVKLRQRYRKAALLLNDLAESGTPPTLKIKIGRTSNVVKRNNPFGQHTNY